MAFTHAKNSVRRNLQSVLRAGLASSTLGVLALAACSTGSSPKAATLVNAAVPPDSSIKAPSSNTKGAPARPERDPSAPAAYSSAATDLQSLFDDMKKQGEVSISSETSNSQNTVIPPQTPELALDRVAQNRPAPTPVSTPSSAPTEQASLGMMVRTTVVAGTLAEAPSPSQGAETKAPEPAPVAVPLENAQPESAPAEAAPTQTALHPAAQSQTKVSPRAKTPRDARELDSIAGALSPEQHLPPAPAPRSAFAIGTTALCSRVESFGRFTPLPSTKFIAGKPALMILYTELGGFSQTESAFTDTAVSPDVSTGDAAPLRIVELAQQVELLLDSDGSRQFLIPEQLVRDSSRTSRKDFFVVQRVELPRNLSVGKYNLKVTVRDVASGAIAERITPIVIVADPNLTSTREGGVLPPGVITPETASERDGLRLPNKPKASKTR